MAEGVPIQPDLLRWARNRVNLGIADLPSLFPRYSEWEDGKRHPTMRQLEQFAEKTRTPLGYLFLANPPVEKLPIPDFRTMRDEDIPAPRPELLDTIYRMQQRQAWVRGFLMEEGVDSLEYVKSIMLGDDIRVASERMRETMKLQPDWAANEKYWGTALNTLISRIEEAGVMVMTSGVVGDNTHRPLDVAEFRGFVLCDGHAPLVFLNNRDAKSAQMFTLIHELAHVWLGKEGVSNLKQTMPGTNAIEKFCNQIAAEFLIPTDLFIAAWREADHLPDRFDVIAKRFKVSRIVAARQALDMRQISRDEFFKFYEECQNEEKSQRPEDSGGDYYRTKHRKLGDRFSRLVHQAVRSERLMYADAYRLTGLRGKTFDQYMSQFGGRV